LQNWEQQRNKPAGTAAILLRIAAKHPEIVKKAAKMPGWADRTAATPPSR
jgi:hypothetical protein